MHKEEVIIIGGGLAGCEAAWQLISANIPVVMFEMRPNKQTNAHKTSTLSELVCSNSFRSDDYKNNAIGLLHEEMRKCNSLILKSADFNKVPAGGALAVDRHNFSNTVQDSLAVSPLFKLITKEYQELPPPSDKRKHIIATGPLTSDLLSKSIINYTGENSLAFFDSIAPIIYRDSIDFSFAWYQSRYDKSGPGGDKAAYINIPLDKEDYIKFVQGLIHAENKELKDWESDTPYFEGCLPIEVMASRGIDTLRYGPMKPVGLINPKTGKVPYAVIQLRQDNTAATLYNMVGFQTKIKHKSQVDILRQLPGLKNARFARLGGIHRNTFLNSPDILDKQLRLKNRTNIYFAGQIVGVEGYVESAAIGLIVGQLIISELYDHKPLLPPTSTALGALVEYIINGTVDGRGKNFQPMNINFGLIDSLKDKLPKKIRREAISKRALCEIDNWLEQLPKKSRELLIGRET
tara:strand:+ start:14203 stop:15591 length:1389 start_codon:yes stop_codon:yes gene_type:complete